MTPGPPGPFRNAVYVELDEIKHIEKESYTTRSVVVVVLLASVRSLETSFSRLNYSGCSNDRSKGRTKSYSGGFRDTRSNESRAKILEGTDNDSIYNPIFCWVESMAKL